MIQAITGYKTNVSPSFKETSAKVKTPAELTKNPIKSGFEYNDAVKAAIGGGILLALRLLLEAELWTGAASNTLAEGMNGKLKLSKGALTTGAALFFGFSLLCILGVMPKYLYKKKLEIFKKKNETKAFINANAAEQGLYRQIDSKAKESDSREELDKLSGHLVKMETARSKSPVKY